MPKHWTSEFSYVTGAVLSGESASFALVSDALAARKQEHAFLVDWKRGQWFRDEDHKRWDVVSMCVCLQPLVQFLAMGPAGQVNCSGSGNVHDELIGSVAEGPRTRGPLRKIRGIGGLAYAAGMNRQVYCRDKAGIWQAMDTDMRPRKGGPIVGFESIDGFDAAEIYAVGWDGAMWLFDGKSWTEIASPTNLILTDVCCAGDGLVYAAGLKGLLLRGRGQQWEIVQAPTPIDDVWSIAWFQGSIFLSTFRGVYQLEKDDYVLVDMGIDPPATSFHLARATDQLWSIGAKDVLVFDGQRWRRFD